MPEHQKVQKRPQNIQSIQDKKRNMQKESGAAQEEMQRIREEINRNEKRFLQLSDKWRRGRATEFAGRRGERRQQCFANK